MSAYKRAFTCKIFMLIFSVAIGTNCFAQQKVSGRVIDSASSQGLPSVNVTVKGTTRVTSTDANGNYSITVSSGEVLVFSSVAYTSREMTVGSNPVIPTVILSARNAQLSEVVVIGYGQRQKKDVTGAVSQIGARDIEKSTAVSPELALQGRAAGVFVGSQGGDPQARTTIRIRGVNTFGNAEPLYVIDGVPIYEGGSGVTGGAVGDIRSP